MNNLDESLIPALTELGGEPLLGSGFEAELPDSDSSVERTQSVEETIR
jgi:hypothetical protein